jgi:triacylglycerol lipase
MTMRLVKTTFLVLITAGICFSCRNKEEPKAPKTPSPPAHNDSITACVLSQIAYTGRPNQYLDSFLPGWKTVCNPVPLNGNYAFAARNQNTLAIAIRGSLMEFSEAAFQNWVYQDMNALRQTKWEYAASAKEANISDGAYTGWKNLAAMNDTANGNSLWGCVQAALKEGLPVLVTGHSLGGNLATVFASWLKWKSREDGFTNAEINIITFAAPAAGDAAFAREINLSFPNAQCYINTLDIVPKFPSVKGIKELGNLFENGATAKDIEISYRGISVKMSRLFSYMGDALNLARLFSGFSDYEQPKGKIFTGKLLHPGAVATIGNWFEEAGYQHGIRQYALSIGAPALDGIFDEK